MSDDIFNKEHLIFGCGNLLLGDDGFGPAVVAYYEKHCVLPDNAAMIDAGTAIRDYLFNIVLAAQKPKRIIVVDAADNPDKKPGDIFEIDVSRINPAKIHDFSLHQFPAANMLAEIQAETSTDVRILAVQTEPLPEYITRGLSGAVSKAVPQMCDRIQTLLKGEP